MTRQMLTLALLLGAPLAAAAQQPGPATPDPMSMCATLMTGMHGMMPGAMGGQMQGGQMQGMQMGDSMMSHMQRELGLSEAQMQQMQAAHQRACAAARPHLELAMQAHHAAMQTLQGDAPDLAAFEARMQEAAGHAVKAHVAVVREMLDFRKTLTPEQRQKMDRMHQQMMQGDMMPGMRPDTAGHQQHHPGAR